MALTNEQRAAMDWLKKELASTPHEDAIEQFKDTMGSAAERTIFVRNLIGMMLALQQKPEPMVQKTFNEVFGLLSLIVARLSNNEPR